jgi:hypothetical protein
MFPMEEPGFWALTRRADIIFVSQLAKTELRNLFRELLTRRTTVEFGESDLLYSNFVHGVKRLRRS